MPTIRTVSPAVVSPRALTTPAAPAAPRAAKPASLAAGNIDSFREAAKDIAARRSQAVTATKAAIGALPAGIVSNPSDVASLKASYQKLTQLKPMLPGQQNQGDRVLKVLNTDFAQTEIAGLKPSGQVYQVLEGGNTRANFSQFTPTGGGPALSAVEFGKLETGLNGSKVTITGLYGFATPATPMTAKDYLNTTKGIKKSLAVADAVSTAAKSGPQVGPRSPQTVNAFVTALATQDMAALQKLIPANVTASQKADIVKLASSLNADERAALTRMGPIMDLNTNLGPVSNGTIENVGVGYQNIGFDDGKHVGFESGTAKDAYGNAFDTKNLKPGQPGYKYTFFAEVQDISK
jgi:hypothetical protein